ncbi:MAG: hypothetical protein Q9201_003072 [Fulgogasparrea decipioides]
MDGRGPKSPRIRTIIRKQAMSKAAVARKRRGMYGKRIVCQYPVHLNVLDQPERNQETYEPRDTSIRHDTDQHHDLDQVETVVKSPHNSELPVSDLFQTSDVPALDWIPASPPSTGYEAARIRYGFDVVALSPLTALHVGRATAQPLHANPARLLDILQNKQWSYFDFLPGRFGQTQCLDDAICCVVARVRQWITTHGEPCRQTLGLYARAVKSLQTALDDPATRLHPNVLCATEVLSIFELLDEERDYAWHVHATGAATLIRLRGPNAYQTEFEKALLIAQIGPIYTEAVLKVSPCFLQQPAWDPVFESLMVYKSNFSACGTVMTSMWESISPIPGLFHSVRAIVCATDETSPTERDELLERLLKLRSQIVAWGDSRNITNSKLRGTIEFNLLLERADSVAECEVFSVYASILLILERLIVALEGSTAWMMEAHAQQLAWGILELKKKALASMPQASLSLALKVMIAKAALLTGEEWRQDVLRRGPKGVVARDVFERWVRLAYPKHVAREFQKKYTQLSKSLWPWESEADLFCVESGNPGAAVLDQLLSQSRETVASQPCYVGTMLAQSLQETI